MQKIDAMLLRGSLALLITLAACSDSGSNSPDAAQSVDAALPTVQAATCPSGTLPTIMTTDITNAFQPNTLTISAGQIVKFSMSSMHNVVPNPLANTDSGLKVNFNETKCLKFTKAGTFGFQCMPHGFGGSVTVQ